MIKEASDDKITIFCSGFCSNVLIGSVLLKGEEMLVKARWLILLVWMVLIIISLSGCDVMEDKFKERMISEGTKYCKEKYNVRLESINFKVFGVTWVCDSGGTFTFKRGDYIRGRIMD